MYNFDKNTDRSNTLSLKWDVEENELPMWVADMDFEVCKEIVDGFIERLKKPALGYTIIDESWYESYISWWEKRHNFKMEKDNLLFVTGVVPAISSAVRRFTHPNENVVILTPVYNIFYNSIINNGARVLECPLDYIDDQYHINFARLEEALRNTQTTLLIFCNPHNPVGKIYSKEELARVGSLCKKYNVVVISDEIHCDLTEINKSYIPFASVNEVNKDISITMIAPTKAFNLAGIQTAAIYVSNEYLKYHINRQINTDEVAEPNVLAAIAPSLAFTKGERWLDELRGYISNNRKYAFEFLKKNLPNIKLVSQDATYLLWLDCSYLNIDSDKLVEHIRKSSKLIVSSGKSYGELYKTFIRVNIATSLDRVIDGLNRLKKAIYELEEN